MKPFQAIKKLFRDQVRKAFDPTENIDLQNVVGWRSIGGSSTYGFYHDNQYENGYSSIRVLAESFSLIEQYTIDKTGKPVPSNILDRLYTPNTDMSAFDFREALMVCSLVQDKVRLRVHHSGARITADNIKGFTFMEGYSERVVGGKRDYMMPNGEVLTDAEVITLKSVNPDNITGGFSPSRAARRWTRLDDYIADYQKGFFENGAIPSGQMIITARTVGEFNDIVDTLQARHRGASKQNNITYTHRPTDATGAPQNSQIEWVPFASENKQLALKDIFEQVNKKIDSSYGVPASLRAVNDANTYASIRVDEVILVKYALYPKTLKVWSKFTHELNRITGGAGVAVSFELEIPTIADEELIKAQATQTEADTVSTLTTEGYTLDSAIQYVKTGNLEVLKLGTPPKEDKPDVLDAEEARDTPEQPIDIYSRSLKPKIASRDIPTLYDDLTVDDAMVKDESLRGCIMLKTEALNILKLVDDAESDLAVDVKMDRSPVPGETSPHITLRFGLLNNGNIWKGAVDEVLRDWKADTITILEVGFFTLPDSYAIVAHIKPTSELIDAHNRLGLLPNAETFSDYRPHMTLAYVKKDADLGKWIKALNEEYEGKELPTAGLDYGDPPEKKKALKKKQLSEIDKELYEFQLSRIIRNQMARQVDKAVARIDEALASKAYGDTTEEEDKQFTAEMLALMLPLMVIYGNRTVNTAMNLIVQEGLSTQNVTSFEFTPAQRRTYEKYLTQIGASYGEQTAEQIRQILGQGILDGATKAEIEQRLRTVILGPENEYRVQRLARTEINLAEGRASVNAMENIMAQTGYKIYKIWHTSGANPCPFCQEMNSTRVLVDQSFLPIGESVKVGEEVFINNWTDVHSAELHANCNCYTTYEVERG